MRRSWFDRTWFYPAVVGVLVAGNAFDLFGTYVYQPRFEHEANPIYVTLRPYGLRLNWPLVIAAKALVCLACAAGLRLFLLRRRRYYPDRPCGFREFLTHFVYGRPLGWIESCFKLPRSVAPGVLSIFAIWSLNGPYFAYLGYGNLASEFGWWRLGGFWAGRYWLDWGGFLWLFVSVTLFGWLLWSDFHDATSAEERPANGDVA